MANMAIPCKIWSGWFGEPMSEMVKKCIASQHIPGYEHFVLTEETLKEMVGVPEYIKVALENKKLVKAFDYLRAWVLYTYGGIFLDADQEILPNKNFDDLLHMKLFASKEENGFVGYSLVGSEPNHKLWEDYLRIVGEKFTPLDGKNFESSMEIFTHLMYKFSSQSGFCSFHRAPTDPNCKICFPHSVTILSPDYFFPYNHQTGIINVTENTRTFHHFMKTWTDVSPDILPTVSIIIPQLGRPEGLMRCLGSIDALYYPKHLVEVLIEEGEDSVPIKVKRAFEKSKGEVIVYASNDIEFTPESLYIAILESRATKKGLAAFNTGELLPDLGNICEHFLIRRSLVELLENKEIFSIEFHHVGVDNWLWEQAKRLGEETRCEEAIVHHYHFSKGAPNDEVYEKGWKNAEMDRKLLKTKLETL